jgi:hypothetical protein
MIYMKNLMALSASAALLTLSLGCNNCQQDYVEGNCYVEREPFFRSQQFYGPRVQYYGGYNDFYGGYGGYGYYRGPRVNAGFHYIPNNRPHFENNVRHEPPRNFSPRPPMHSPNRGFTPQRNFSQPPRGNNSRHR